jgi:hypothetical protein
MHIDPKYKNHYFKVYGVGSCHLTYRERGLVVVHLTGVRCILKVNQRQLPV